ncbi:MAG: NAD(P)/FAD-dependent oxidoreductase [Polyangiales bacterium]
MGTTTGPDDFDVAVIGGGPAGSTTAALLAREGRRVVVIDRDRWPRYHIGESLLPGVLPFLEELGAKEAVEALGFHRKTGQTFRWGKDRTPWRLDFRELDVYPYAYFVERADFDHALLQNAKRLGAELREETSAEGVLVDPSGRVRGVNTRGPDGEARAVTARYVVDASGQVALLAKRFDTRRWVKGLRNLAVWSYWEGTVTPPSPEDEHIFTVSIPDGWVWFIPLRNGRVSVGVVTVDWTRERAAQPRDERDLDGWYERTARGAETIGEMLSGGRRVEPVRAQRDWSYCTTRFHGPGYCLAGDAACFIDPILSTGVQLAMTGGYLAALAVNSALGEPAREAAFFRYYQQAYLATYREQLTQVRYFYRTEAHRESVFWKSKRLLRVDPQLDGALAFVFLNSGLARHVTAEHPHDLPGQARAAFSSLRDAPEARPVAYRPATPDARRQLVPPGDFAVTEGPDRRLYGVSQRGLTLTLTLEPLRSPRWSQRPEGTALLFEVASSPASDPVGTVTVERDRDDLPHGVARHGGLAATTRAYRWMKPHEALLRRAAEDLLALADSTDLAALDTRVRASFTEASARGWSLARLPPVDRLALVEHPVSAELRRESDGAAVWVIAQARRRPEAHESPFARTRFVDLDYSSGAGERLDDDALAAVESVAVATRDALRAASTLPEAIDLCQTVFARAEGVPAGWRLASVRRVAPNLWADDEDPITDE